MADKIAMIVIAVWFIGYLYLLYDLFFQNNDEGKNNMDDLMKKAEDQSGPMPMDDKQLRGVLGFLAAIVTLFWPLIIIVGLIKTITGQK